MKALSSVRGGVLLSVRAVPRASRNAVCVEQDGTIRVRLQAPPVEGKANDALARFLAGELGIPRRRVEIVAGEKGRNKRVLITGLDAATIASRLGLQQAD